MEKFEPAMKHEEIRPFLEEYVFGALEEPDFSAVEAHLTSGCADCRSAVKELSELALKLAQTVPAETPAPAVREKLLARIAEGRLHPASKTSRLTRRAWIPALVSAAAAVALFFWGNHLNQENKKLRQQLAEAEDVTRLLASPGMEFVGLKGVDPNPQAFGKAVVDKDKGDAVVYMYRLPQTPEGKEYQLWVMKDGQPTSAGLFRVASDGSASLKLHDLPESASFLVTIEPEGGQPVPTGMMYLTGPNTP